MSDTILDALICIEFILRQNMEFYMGTGGHGERNKLIQGTASGRCRFELDDVILESVHSNTAAYCLFVKKSLTSQFHSTDYSDCEGRVWMVIKVGNGCDPKKPKF